tara:strand:+ start:819 stop:2615 length:1797 start_codon:yes stop_codon:yes gene_type:complete
MSVDFTYEKGALAEFLDELPDLILKYQQNQIQLQQRNLERKEDREWKEQLEETRKKEHKAGVALEESKLKAQVEENRLRRVQETNILKLQSELELKGAQSQRYLELAMTGLERDLDDKRRYDEEIANLGITTDSLNELDDLYKSLDAIDISKATESDLQQRSDIISDQLDARLGLIAEYKAGASVAKNIDTNRDWIITSDEIDEYEKSTNKKMSQAFRAGVDSYAADAQQMLQMVSQQVDIQAKEAEIDIRQETLKQLQIESEFLPQKYKTAQLRDELNIDTGKLNLDILKDSRDQSKLVREGLSIDNQTKQQQLNAIKAELENAEIAKNEEKYNKYKQNIQEIRTANIEKQAYIGASSLVDISIGSGSRKSSGAFSTYKPFLSIIAEEDLDISTLEDAFSEYSLISDDLIDLYNAYNMGVSEDQLANYQLVLEQMQEIGEYKKDYDKFMTNNKNLLGSKASELKLPWNHRKVINSVLNESEDLTPIEVIGIKKKLEWEDTGVYDNFDKFNIINNILNQNIESQQLYENVLLHQHNVSSPADLPTGVINITPALQGVATKEDVSAIFDPFRSIITGSGSKISGTGAAPGYYPSWLVPQ